MENETEDTKEIEKQQRSAADYIFSEACPREPLHHSVRLIRDNRWKANKALEFAIQTRIFNPYL